MRLPILTGISIIAFVAYAGFSVGKIMTVTDRQPTEIRNGCAYYDMDSGKFTWGMRPLVVSELPSNPPLIVDRPTNPDNDPAGILLPSSVGKKRHGNN